MSISRIENLACGLAKLTGGFDNPDSDAFRLRNPVLARAYSFKHLADTDDKGRRIFSSFIGGFRFLVQDLTWKCAGDTRARGSNGKLSPESTISELLAAFRLDSEENIFELIDFLQRAATDQEINSQTELSYFIKGEEKDAIRS